MPTLRINVYAENGFALDLTGKRHGMLTALDFNFLHPRKGIRWLVRCDCGAEKFIGIGNWGSIRSCGCIRKKLQSLDHKRLSRILSGMKGRCYNPNSPAFRYYGGRGITVCDEWLVSSSAFFEWALANGYRPGLEIDRRDNYRGYFPDNCHFITKWENLKNKRRAQDKGEGRHHVRPRPTTYIEDIFEEDIGFIYFQKYDTTRRATRRSQRRERLRRLRSD